MDESGESVTNNERLLAMSDKEQGIYTHILKYIGVFGGVQGLSIIIGVLRNKLVAVLLGPAGMGLVSLFNTMLNFISQATSFGISFSAIRTMSELYDAGKPEELNNYVKVVRSWTLFTALLGILTCLVLSQLLNHFIFDNEDHLYDILMLSPVVGMTAITGGEMAILKAIRQLRQMALVQLLAVLSMLLFSVPLFYYFGFRGIIPVFLFTSLANMLITLRCSCRLFPLAWQSNFFGEGMGMVKLGIAFTLAGIMGSAAEMIVRSYLNVCGGSDVVGLYNAAYMLCITYAGVVFSAMETDYFPRLSGVNHHVADVNKMVNQQIEVALLLVSPMLCTLIIALPLLVPLLYADTFLPLISMAQIALLAMYMRAITLSVSYVMLAKGDSIAYLSMESVYDLLLVLFVLFFYQRLGFVGTGVALVVLYFVDMLLLLLFTRYRYHIRLSKQVFLTLLMQLPIGVAAYIVARSFSDYAYWLSGILLALLSLTLTLITLHRKTKLWNALKSKFLRHG